MASGEMSGSEFLTFNLAWMKAALDYLADGGLFGTFIDWRGLPTVHAAATQLGVAPINLIVWAKTNAGMGSLYRSQHELLPLFKRARAIISTISTSAARDVGLQPLGLPRRLFDRVGCAQGPPRPPDRETDGLAGGRASRCHGSRRYRDRSFPWVGIHAHRRPAGEEALPRRRD
jgi:hypothetical protein